MLAESLKTLPICKNLIRIIEENAMTRHSREYNETLRNDIGKTMLSRDKQKKGTITNIVYRTCAVCGYGPTYSVKWEDGKRTFPCPAGCEHKNNTVHIL